MNLPYDNDQRREEGGFQTRPYESHFFFAYFARYKFLRIRSGQVFAVNSLLPFGYG